MKCPECNGVHFIENREGFIVCGDCGCVISDISRLEPSPSLKETHFIDLKNLLHTPRGIYSLESYYPYELILEPKSKYWTRAAFFRVNKDFSTKIRVNFLYSQLVLRFNLKDNLYSELKYFFKKFSRKLEKEYSPLIIFLVSSYYVIVYKNHHIFPEAFRAYIKDFGIRYSLSFIRKIMFKSGIPNENPENNHKERFWEMVHTCFLELSLNNLIPKSLFPYITRYFDLFYKYIKFYSMKSLKLYAIIYVHLISEIFDKSRKHFISKYGRVFGMGYHKFHDALLQLRKRGIIDKFLVSMVNENE